MRSPPTERCDTSPRSDLRQFIAAVEVIGDEEESQRNLLHAAYFASRQGVVAVMLRGLSIDAADYILDPVVKSLPKDIPGIIYIDADDVLLAKAAMASAKKLYVSGAELLKLVDRSSQSACCCAPAELTKEFSRSPDALWEGISSHACSRRGSSATTENGRARRLAATPSRF